MADEQRIRFVADFDDSIISKVMDNMADATDSQQDKFDELAKSGDKAFSEIGKAISDNEKKTGSLAKATADYQEELADANKEGTRFRDILKSQAREISVFGVRVGDVVDKLGRLQKNLTATRAGLRGVSGGLRILKAALVSTGIGAIAVALGSLVALLTRTQKGIDFVSRVMAGLGAAISVVIDRFSQFGGGIVKLFRGDLSGAVDAFRGSIKGLGQEIREETKAAVDLEKRAQALRDNTRELSVEIARRRSEIARLRFESRNEELSATQRAAKVREALRLEQELEAERIRLARENVEIIKARNDLGESLTADLEKRAQAEIELFNIQQESAEKQRESLSELNALMKEEQARIKAIRDEYNKFLDDLELGQLTGLDRLQAEKDLALQEVENFRKEIIAAATKAGLELPESFKADIAALINAIEAEFKKQVDALREGDTELQPINVLGGSERDFEQAGKDAIAAGAKGMEQGAKDSKDIITRIKESILVAFKITEEELQFIGSALGSTFDNVLGTLDATTEIAIQKQDAILSAIENRIQETERLLSQEEQRQKEGFANDVSALKEKLAAEQAEREKAEERRLQLEKKAANQRLLQNSLEQGSNFLLAVTRMIATQSFGGIAGIFTALAGVALITRIVAQAKAASAQFEVPQFREGTPYLHGPGSETSDSIFARLSVGERVMPALLNKQIGGEQISNEELVRTYELGKLFEGANRSPLSGAVAEARRDQRRLEELKVNLPFEIMQKAYQDAANKAADKMISYWKSRPVEKPDGEGGKVVEWKEGQRIECHKIKKKQQ